MTIGSAACLPGHEPGAPPANSRSFGPKPSLSAEPATIGHGASPSQSRRGETDDLPRERILVAGDEVIVALDLQGTLRQAGYRIVGPVFSKTDVETLLRRGPVDCAVLDINLDGQATFAMADLLASSGIPFVLVAGCSPDELPKEHAARPMVAKPYTADQLLSAIRRQVSRDPGENTEHCYPTTPEVVSWPRVLPQL
jgi:CheY-like chemotaxis protein